MKIFKLLTILTAILIATNAVAEPVIGLQKNTATRICGNIWNATTGKLIGAAPTGLDCEVDLYSDGTSADGYSDISTAEVTVGTTGAFCAILTAAETNDTYIMLKCTATNTNAADWAVLIDTKHGTVLTNASGALDTDTIPGSAFTADGTLQSGTSTTAQLASAETYANDEPNGRELCLVAGTGKGQCREITDYVSSTDTATVASWTTTPDNTSKYVLGGYVSATVSGTVSANVTQWNGTNVASPHTAGYPVVTIKDGTSTGEIDTSSGAIASVTTAGTCSALGVTAKSDVNAELVDVMTVDTVSELSACPTAGATMRDKITFVYQYLRHKLTSSSSAMTLYKDDESTSLCTNTIGDSGSLFTRGELN